MKRNSVQLRKYTESTRHENHVDRFYLYLDQMGILKREVAIVKALSLNGDEQKKPGRVAIFIREPESDWFVQLTSI